MNSNIQTKKAFTLVELLIVLALISLMTGVLLIRSNKNSQEAKAAAQILIAQIRSVQNSVLTGTVISTKSICQSTISFDPDAEKYYVKYYDSCPVDINNDVPVNNPPNGDEFSLKNIDIQTAGYISYLAPFATADRQLTDLVSGDPTNNVLLASASGTGDEAAIYINALGIPSTADAQSPVCTSFTYNACGACQPNNTCTRTVATSSPAGCTGGNPILSQSCVYTAPTCTSWPYSVWGACQLNNTQTRTVLTQSPSGCTGGSPILSQSCVYTAPTCTSWTYSVWGACQSNNTQTRTVLTQSPSGCTGGSPILSQSCTYCPSTVTSNGLTYGTVVIGSQCWLDRNLGATQVATAYNDANAYGWYFQWGRGVDGHQYLTSPVIFNMPTSSITPGSSFITSCGSPFDWLIPQNNSLWQAPSYTNNPCPSGWHVPTQSEWYALITSLGFSDNAFCGSVCTNIAASSALKLPVAGRRGGCTGTSTLIDTDVATYWSSTTDAEYVDRLFISWSYVSTTSSYTRSEGWPVRCIKN